MCTTLRAICMFWRRVFLTASWSACVSPMLCGNCAIFAKSLRRVVPEDRNRRQIGGGLWARKTHHLSGTPNPSLYQCFHPTCNRNHFRKWSPFCKRLQAFSKRLHAFWRRRQSSAERPLNSARTGALHNYFRGASKRPQERRV